MTNPKGLQGSALGKRSTRIHSRSQAG